ncbi:MAG: 3-hydroxyacyl-ACP dehydratase FabZ family protein [Planctomycetota bacterium]
MKHDIDEIRQHNPQRGDMEHLNAVVWTDEGRIIGRKDVTADEFWVEGHIPGRPLLPGVIMLEAAAQASSFLTATYVGWDGFIGFGGLEDVKFRTAVEPGQTLYILCELIEKRHRRIKAKCQGVVNGGIAFEATIIGTRM